MFIINPYVHATGTSLDPATQTLLDQADTDGYTAASGTVLTALDTFIKSLKSDGIWSLLDVLWLPATNGDVDFAGYNLKDPTTFNLTRVNSPTFTSLEGFTGDGATSYLNSGWNPNINGSNFTLNDSSFGYYQRKSSVNTSGRHGGDNSTPVFILVATQNSSNIGSALINQIATVPSDHEFTNSSPQGFLSINRESSATNRIYKNGSLVETETVNSSVVPSIVLYWLSRNANGTASNFSDDQLSFMYYGADLTSKASELYTAIQDYMTSIGKQV